MSRGWWLGMMVAWSHECFEDGGVEATKQCLLVGLEAPEAWKPCKLRVLVASGLLECNFTTRWPWTAILRQV